MGWAARALGLEGPKADHYAKIVEESCWEVESKRGSGPSKEGVSAKAAKAMRNGTHTGGDGGATSSPCWEGTGPWD